MNTLPVIDFAGYDERDPAATASLARDVDRALSEVGFMAIRNFGIPKQDIVDVFGSAREFFDGNDAVKQRCAYQSASENFGYQGVAEEHLDPTAPADLKETFTMRNVVNRPLDDSRWPSAAFGSQMTAFYSECLRAAFKLMRVIAHALDLDPEFFVQHHSGENVTLRLLHYPAIGDRAVEPGQLGAGAHTDYGLLTLLFQQNVSGLEVRASDGQWQPVAADPDAVVINSGDLLEVWTNGRYRSTPHRVKPISGDQSRQSIAMFVDPDSVTEVSALPSCLSSNESAAFAPTTAGAHLQARIEASHKARFDV
ncbi:MAG: 2OG-Fe(II) oxygenase family protein [Pseudomonadota bacterium]